MTERGISLDGVVSSYNDRHVFVYELVLALIARETTRVGSLNISKADFARSLGCSIRSLDRAVTRLRRTGMVSSKPVFGDNGAQLGNTYRVTRKGAASAAKYLAQGEQAGGAA